MEQRKLIQHGASSLTTALPLKWLKQRNLKKGDTIYIEEEGNKLIVSTKEAKKMGKISVDVTKLDRTSTLLYVQSLYRFGYDEVEIKFNKPTTVHHRSGKYTSYSSIIHYIVSRCIGFEIIEQSENKITIKHIIKEEREDFKVILRRIFLLLIDAVDSLLNGIKKNDMNIVGTIEQKHDNINNFVSYCLRLLNKYGHPDVKQTCFYYHTIATIDKIMDIVKYNARDVLKLKKQFSKITLNIIEDINKSIRMYYDLFYKFDLAKVNQIEKNRYYVRNNLETKANKISPQELLYLTSMKQILEIILDLIEVRMGLEY